MKCPVTARNFWALMKQCHDFSDDYKFHVTAERLIEKGLLFSCCAYQCSWSGLHPQKLKTFIVNLRCNFDLTSASQRLRQLFESDVGKYIKLSSLMLFQWGKMFYSFVVVASNWTEEIKNRISHCTLYGYVCHHKQLISCVFVLIRSQKASQAMWTLQWMLVQWRTH